MSVVDHHHYNNSTKSSPYLLQAAFLPQAKFRPLLEALVHADYVRVRICVDSSGMYVFNSHNLTSLIFGTFQSRSFRFLDWRPLDGRQLLQFELSLPKLCESLKALRANYSNSRRSKSNAYAYINNNNSSTGGNSSMDCTNAGKHTTGCSSTSATTTTLQAASELVYFQIFANNPNWLNVSVHSVNEFDLYSPDNHLAAMQVPLDWECDNSSLFNSGELPPLPNELAEDKYNAIRLPTTEWRRQVIESSLALPMFEFHLYPNTVLFKCSDSAQLTRGNCMYSTAVDATCSSDNRTSSNNNNNNNNSNNNTNNEVCISTNASITFQQPLIQRFYIAHLIQACKLYQWNHSVQIVLTPNQPLMIVMDTPEMPGNHVMYCIQPV
jgi:hypothetical protein